MREQDYLAQRGYVVLHTDYRNHAQSSDDPRSELDLRLGYSEDVINAVTPCGPRSTSIPSGSDCSAVRWAAGSRTTCSSRNPVW
jgi:hypothetical protein